MQEKNIRSCMDFDAPGRNSLEVARRRNQLGNQAANQVLFS